MSKLIRRESVYLYLFFTALYLLTAILSSVASSAAYTLQQRRLDRYGEWQAAVLNCSEPTETAVKRHAAVQNVGEINIVGEVYAPSGTFCCNLGTIDGMGKELGRLQLAEGEWPTQPDEIVLEYSTLGYLCYSYDIGQRIQLNVTYIGNDEKEYVQAAEFRLSGILPSYAANWENGSAVSGIINEESSVMKLPGSYKNILIEGAYDPEDGIYELEKLMTDKEQFVFNNGAYPPILSGLVNFLENGMADIMLGVIAFASIGCAAQTYMLKRRNEIYILWMLGASKSYHLRFYLKHFLRCWAVSFPLGTAVGVLIVKGASALTRRLLFSYPSDAFIKLFLIGLAALLLGVLVPILAGLRRSSDEEKRGLPISRAAFLRGKKYNISRIYCSAHAKQMFLWALLPLIVTVAVHMVFFSGFQNYTSNIHDYVPEEPDFTWGGNGRAGMSDQSLQQLWSTEGVEMVDAASVVDCDDLYWDGFEGSNYLRDYRNYIRERFGTEPKGSTWDWDVYGLDSDSSWTKWLLSQVEDASHLQNNEFVDQNTVILSLPSLAVGSEKGCSFYRDGDYLSAGTQIVDESTVKVGDVINVVIYGNKYQLTVGGIVRRLAENDRYGFRFCTEAQAFVSQGNLSRLLGGKLPYNFVSAYLHDNADGELTAKLVSRIDSDGLPFENRYEDKTARRQSFLIYLVYCIVMLSLIFVIYAMLTYILIQNTLTAEGEKLQLIRDLGGDERIILRKAILTIFLFCMFCTVIVGALFMISTCMPSISYFAGELKMPILYSVVKAINVWSPRFPALLYALTVCIISILPVAFSGSMFYKKAHKRK